MRSDGRLAEQLRPTRITPNYLMHAEGSVLVEAGKTKVICTASVEDRVPPFRRNTGKGWVTAEYGMLPRATTTRSQREASAGKVGGRTQEIQRLIGGTEREGLTLIPLELYFKDGLAKVAIALAKAKKLHDKREDLKRRTAERELARDFRGRR